MHTLNDIPKSTECIVFYQHKLLVLSTSNTLPKVADIQEICQYLQPIVKTDTAVVANINNVDGNLDDINFDINLSPNTNLKLIGLRLALNHFNPTDISRISYYYQLQHYYTRNKFCGSCGNTTARNTRNKFITCNHCQHEIYPHIAPCIIVRIHKDDQILMARGVNFQPNAWGLIAGFVEINECLEDAVIREVKEEVGIEIHNIKYWGSQPWPFPTNSILACFTADYKSGEITPDPIEISDAGFFDTKNIPGIPATNYSITSKMIKEWQNSFN
jgi:NAD+ diphosphatase